MPGESGDDVGLSEEVEVVRLMKGTINRLNTEMGERLVRLKNLDNKFGFFLDVKGLLSSVCPEDKEHINSIKQKYLTLANFYDTDLHALELFDEIMDCRMLLKSRGDMEVTTPEQLLRFIVQHGNKSVFPNLRVGLQILLTGAISIASSKRSFSKLKLILSSFRTTTGEDRLLQTHLFQ